jgi:hypothetical protein
MKSVLKRLWQRPRNKIMTRESMKRAIEYDLNQKKRLEERKEYYERFDRQIDEKKYPSREQARNVTVRRKKK